MYIDLTHISDYAYKMATIVNLGNHNDIVCFEFHIQPNKTKHVYSSHGLDEFRKRSEDFYQIMIAEGYVDDYEANISVVLKIGNNWFVSNDCGSNYYLGYGPSGIIALREACFKKTVPIIVVEEKLEEWMKTMKIPESLNISEEVIDVQKTEHSEFERITRLITNFSSKIQDAPQPYENLSEPQLRDIFLQPLNLILDGRAHGESKLSKGKTDILIRALDGKHNFVFELKKWKGLKDFENAINQLRSYLNYDDSRCGLIFFCYEVDFSAILKKVKHQIGNSYTLIKGYEKMEREFRFGLKHLNDSEEKVEVHVLFINLKIADKFEEE